MELGLLFSFYNTFGISIVVWFGIVGAVILLARSESDPPNGSDALIDLFAACTFLIPPPFVSWLGIAALALALSLSPKSDEAARRAGTILFALTIPLLWGHASCSRRPVRLIGWIVWTGSTGNMIPFANGVGVVFLEPNCSSITNLSLAFLCAVIFVELRGQGWSGYAILATLAAGTATVVINVCRIALIALLPQHYDAIHGPVGVTIAAWLTVAAIVAILALGTKSREPVAGSSALALLLATSLAIKSYVSMSGRVLAAQPDDSDIAAMLAANGFEMTVPMPATDPSWFLGETGDCRIYIAGISPQGWHRAAVEWKAQSVNGQASYLTENEMTGQQPV